MGFSTHSIVEGLIRSDSEAFQGFDFQEEDAQFVYTLSPGKMTRIFQCPYCMITSFTFLALFIREKCKVSQIILRLFIFFML